jgi:NTE family protein
MAGWLPRGVISTEPLRRTIERVVPHGWSEHPGHWVVACDYATGRRVAFGREDAPRAELSDAVAASCAIPGFYHPVKVAGRRYVDGGMYSNSNLDLLCNEGLDLVICLNPTSTLHPLKAWNPAERVAAVARRASGRRLGSEAKKLRACGTEVVLIQPTGKDLEVMGPNLMSRSRRHVMIETAIETVSEQVEQPGVRELIRDLPPTTELERVRRPKGPPSSWPPLAVMQRRELQEAS